MKIGGLGFHVRMFPITVDSKPMHGWELKRFGKVLGTGICSTAKKSETAVSECFAQTAMSAATSAAEKQPSRNKIERLTKTRPYLTVSVMQNVLSGLKRETLLRQAAECEQFLWESDDSEYRQPLSTHHRTLPAAEAAEQLLNAMQVVGWTDENDKETRKQVRAHLKRMYGPEWAGGES